MIAADQAALFAQARSLLSSLSRTAERVEPAMAYEQVLIALDRQVRVGELAMISPVAGEERYAVYREAQDTLRALTQAGADAFEVGICGTMLATAWDEEQAQEPRG